MSAQKEKIWTYVLTNDSITITDGHALKYISIYNGTSTAGSVQGQYDVPNYPSAAISIEENEYYNANVVEGSAVLDGLIITAPAGCTLKITGAI